MTDPIGIPYARPNDDGTVTCPVCGERIAERHDADGERTSNEYALHYEHEHTGVWPTPAGRAAIDRADARRSDPYLVRERAAREAAGDSDGEGDALARDMEAAERSTPASRTAAAKAWRRVPAAERSGRSNRLRELADYYAWDLAGHKVKRYVAALGEHIFETFDDLDDALSFLGDCILENGCAEPVVYDLDTGERIDVHVTTPVVTRSSEQGFMENPLTNDWRERREAERDERKVLQHWDGERYVPLVPNVALSDALDADRETLADDALDGS